MTRQIIKNKKVLAAIFAVLLVFSAGTVFAQYVAPQKDINIIEILNRIINWMYGLLLILAGAFILYAAFLYLTSGGDPKAVGTAKNYILYTVVAIAVAFFARAIVYIVQQLLGV